MKKRFSLYLFLSVAWMIIIFCFSAQPGEDSSKMSGFFVDLLSFLFWNNEFLMERASFIIRKCAHMSEYALLAILLHQLFHETTWHKQAIPLAWIGAVLYACSDEFHQLFVPGRGGMIQDVGIDAIGAALGLVALIIVQRWWQHHLEKKHYEMNFIK